MSLLARIAFRFKRRTRRNRELDEEIRSHIRMAIDDHVARGEPREEAERAVRHEFGDPDRVKEVTRTTWNWAWLDRLRQDLRFGVRSLRRDWAFACTAVVVLIVGMGSNAAVFTLANGVLFMDGPGISDPHELVAVRWIESPEQGPSRESSWGYGDYAYLRAEASAFDGVLAYLPQPIAVTTSEETGAQVDAWVVSDNFFQVLGAEMAIGRGFLPEEGQTPGAHSVVVVSNAFWENRLEADPNIIGQTMPLNGTQFTIIGVTARDFRGISPIETPPDLYVPVMMQGVLIQGSDSWFQRIEGTSSGWLRLIARLRDGTMIAAAQASIESVRAGWDDEFGAWWASLQRPAFRMLVTSDYRMTIEQAERLRRMHVLLAAIVAAILIIGTTNVAILLLARAASRQSEIAVRAALGASRARLFAQLLAENLIVAALGGVGGLAVAYLAVRAIVPLLPYQFAWSIVPDTEAAVFIAALILAVTLLCGIASSLRLSRSEPEAILQRTNRISAGSGMRNALVVAQMAGAMVLVIGAALFVRSIVAAQSVDLGFESDDRLILITDLSVRGYEGERGLTFMNEALARAQALPGVERATVMARAPFGGRTTEGVVVPGSQSADALTIQNFNWVGPDYFQTMGIPMVAGRAILSRDGRGSPRALVVNETTAATLWPDENAVDKTVVWKGDVWTVVGVAADATYYALGERPEFQVYVPLAQDFIPFLTFVLEAEVSPQTLARQLESVVRDLDPDLTVFGVEPFRNLVDRQSAHYRLLAVVGSAFGLVALVLVVAGLYGVQSYGVRQRYKEIGIRMAMGAQPWQVSAGILRHGAVLATMGVGLGVLIAWASGRLIEGMLFRVDARDPAIFMAVATILLMTSMAASYFPARRAGGVEPVMVLREE